MSGSRHSIIVERDVPLELRDGTQTLCDVYRPAGAGRAPVILHRTPYGKHVPVVAYLMLDPLRAADEGFVTVVQDVRGRYASAGVFEPYFQEIDDGYDSVEWCAAQAWSDGNVGMIGSSYDGIVQLLAAVARPPHLRCIVPILASSDIYEGWVYSGGALQWGFMVTWVLPWLASERAASAGLADQLRASVDSLRETWGIFEPATLPWVAELAPYFMRWLEHRSRDEFWQQVGICDHYASIDVPSLHVGGWYDIFGAGTARNFAALAAQRPPGAVRLLLGPWAHAVPIGTAAGAVDFGLASGQHPTPRGYDIEAEYLAFLSRWLKGGSAAETAPVRYFVMGVNEWRTERGWPPEGAVTTPLYLQSDGHANTSGGDGELRWSASATGAPSDSFVYDPRDPVPTVGGALCCMAAQLPPGAFDQAAVEERSDVLVYRSEPLSEDLEVTGFVTAELWACTSAADTDLTAKLVDVSPCGCAINLADGILRGSYRDGTDVVRPLVPGEPAMWRIELGITSNVFRAGHRICLEVSSSNFPRFERNMNTLPARDPVVAHQVIFHDEARPSRVLLPIVPSGSAAKR